MQSTEARDSGRRRAIRGVGVVKVDVGDEAAPLLASAEFQEEWSTLHADCPWATVFQTPAFVLTWYRVYAARYEPLVVHSRGRDGRLEGLLLLARSRDTGDVVNAGSIHAEYHAWLTRRASQQTFPVAAFAALRKVIQRGSVTFLFLAPNTPLEWVPAAEATGTFVSIRAHTRGLMRVGAGSEVQASLRKNSNKSRIARLKRTGPVTFELLNTVEQLRGIIGVVAEQSDVRHGGRSAFLPFRADPLKAQLYLELMAEPGLLHATVLRAGREIIATHIGLRDRVPALGLMTHAPQFGAHSPGKLLLLFLGKLLGEEGVQVFDLTPGRRYKERFATHFDDVSVLEVFLDRASHAKFRSKRLAATTGKWVVKAMGRDPKASLRRVARISARVRRAGLVKIARMAVDLVLRQVRSKREFRIYEYPLATVTARLDEALGRMRVNSLRDLLDYSPASPSDPPIIEFLEKAERRLADGNILFSYAENGLLLHYAWLIPAAGWMGSEFGHDIPLPEKPTILWDDFTHPSTRGRGLHQESLRARLAYAAAHDFSDNAIIGVRSDNEVSRHNIESAGFTYCGSAWISTRFGRVRRWVNWEDPSRQNYTSGKYVKSLREMVARLDDE
jgi:CelD/BcsL family acetyltransferase involved in cellulose biosynthesis/RimJ/RimL family protein N-acetyltransferase